VALIECDPLRSETPAAVELVDPGHPRRTGRVAHVKREVFSQLFSVQIAPTFPCVFVEPAVMEMLEALHRESAT
jgi:hypothetical protein